MWLVLGRECGISTAESRVSQIGGRDVLLVKRFDRLNAIARREGVSERDCEKISRAFVYEGFRYSPKAKG